LVTSGQDTARSLSSLQEQKEGAIDALVDSLESQTSQYSHVFLTPVHGAATRVGPTETAFPLREEHHEFTLDAAWEDDGGAAPVRAAYGPNYERLVALKTKYDPENIFHLNQNIKPETNLA
jgi:FAD/FMN-containing dehydrogenase